MEPVQPVEEALGFPLPERSADGRARLAALRKGAPGARSAAGMVGYRSRGRLLIVDPEGRVEGPAAELAAHGLECTVLRPRAAAQLQGVVSARASASVTIVYGELRALDGYLGAFSGRVAAAGRELELGELAGGQGAAFDLVLDLADPPHIDREVPPPGYHAPRGDQAAIAAALAELPALVGEFEKPTFFRYDPDICAHGARGQHGCNLCIDACPTEAIASIGEKIEVDPQLCQGGGSCAAVCPTGAIAYTYPVLSETLGRLRAALTEYRHSGGVDPRLLFYDRERGREAVASEADAWPERVIPWEVEEIGSVGPDVWMAALAYGACAVALYCAPGSAPKVAGALARELDYARAILAGMGHEPGRLALLADRDALDAWAAEAPPGPLAPAAGFVAPDEKRTVLRLAIDHLYAHAPARPEMAPLPAGAPFGAIRVESSGCTLCMACVAVCPAAALAAGDDRPALRFVEANCVQCGLCEVACPEQVISREPRFVYDAEARRRSRLLNEEEPFRCVGCGKPFATQAMMSRMREKLKGHWMFQDPGAFRRLEMCEDCRVKDVFSSEGPAGG